MLPFAAQFIGIALVLQVTSSVCYGIPTYSRLPSTPPSLSNTTTTTGRNSTIPGHEVISVSAFFSDPIPKGIQISDANCAQHARGSRPADVGIVSSVVSWTCSILEPGVTTNPPYVYKLVVDSLALSEWKMLKLTCECDWIDYPIPYVRKSNGTWTLARMSIHVGVTCNSITSSCGALVGELGSSNVPCRSTV